MARLQHDFVNGIGNLEKDERVRAPIWKTLLDVHVLGMSVEIILEEARKLVGMDLQFRAYQLIDQAVELGDVSEAVASEWKQSL